MKINKAKILEKVGISVQNTGCPEAQITILTHEINNIVDHVKLHKGDKHSIRGLMAKINARKSHLKYLQHKSYERYDSITRALNLRQKNAKRN